MIKGVKEFYKHFFNIRPELIQVCQDCFIARNKSHMLWVWLIKDDVFGPASFDEHTKYLIRGIKDYENEQR